MTIEVEQTVELTEDQYNEVLRRLGKEFKTFEHVKRFMTRFHKDKVDVKESLDIRYKWTNGKNQLVVKKGALGSQSRQETTIDLGPNNQLEHFVRLFALLGYKVANVMYREIKRFRNNTVEASIIFTNKDKNGDRLYFMEVEALNASTKKQAMKHIADFLEEFSLKPMSKSEYQIYNRLTDRTVNNHFNMSDFPKMMDNNPHWQEVLRETLYKN